MAVEGEKGNPRVMVVDDEPDLLAYMSALLSDHGFEPVEARSAEEAVKRARADKPDLICLDLMMPGQSGILCYRDMKKDPELCHIPAVMVSAFGRQEDFTGDGFRKLLPDPEVPLPEGFIEKPVEPDRLIRVLKCILDGRPGQDD